MEQHSKQMEAMEETQTTYLDQVEELTHKLTQAEMMIQAHISSRLEEGTKTSQVGLELAEKTARVSELEDFLELKTKEIKQLLEKLTETKDELETRLSKQDKLQQMVEELTNKLKTNEVYSNDLPTEAQNLQAQNADLRLQLKSSKEHADQLAEEKSQMERRYAELKQKSDDKSNHQSMLIEELGKMTRDLSLFDEQIEELDIIKSSVQKTLLNIEGQRLKKTKQEVEELQKENDRLRTEKSQQQEIINQLSDKTTDIGQM